jgi:hypothetical protein
MIEKSHTVFIKLSTQKLKAFSVGILVKREMISKLKNGHYMFCKTYVKVPDMLIMDLREPPPCIFLGAHTACVALNHRLTVVSSIFWQRGHNKITFPFFGLHEVFS